MGAFLWRIHQTEGSIFQKVLKEALICSTVLGGTIGPPMGSNHQKLSGKEFSICLYLNTGLNANYSQISFIKFGFGSCLSESKFRKPEIP